MREVAVLALCFAAASAQCRGGYREGEVLEQDPYWYRCSGGRMRPAGCLTDQGRRIGIDQIYDGTSFAWRCTTTPAGHLTVEMNACLFQGRRVRPGEIVQGDTYWYTCEQSGSWLNGRVGGCMHQGQRVNLEGEVRMEDNVYRCQLTPSGTADLTSVGCLHNGREYKVGETFEDDKYFYSCRRKEEKCVAQTLGCVHRGKRLSAFQPYYETDQMYRCLFSPDLKSAAHVLEGCVKNDPYSGLPLEKKFGCVWEDGRRPFLYLSECVNGTSGRAEVQRIRCKYEGPEGVAEIMPGCWTDLGTLGVGCKKRSGGELDLVTFSATDESYGHSLGLNHWSQNQYECLVFRRR